MSHRIEFDLKDRIILLSFLGLVTDDSFLAGLSAANNFARENGMEGAIVDFSGVEVFQVSMDFIRNYVDTREIVARDKPRVAVAAQPAIYGTLRAFAIHAESSMVFPIPVRTMAEAYTILKLDSPVFGPAPWSGPLDIPKLAGAPISTNRLRRR